MGGPTRHGQHNKAHKAGRTAGLSARQKQRLGKEVVGPHRKPCKSGASQGGKLERIAAAKQIRDAKRNELISMKRRLAAPVVISVLPLSKSVDVSRLWDQLLSACKFQVAENGSEGREANEDRDICMEIDEVLGGLERKSEPLTMQTVTLPNKGRLRLTLLPPPSDRTDLMAVVDIGRAAEVLVLAVPGDSQCAVDEEGQAAVSVLRAMGLPSIVVAVQSSVTKGSNVTSMKERSASKKKAEEAIKSQIAGDHKMFHADTASDCQQLVRHLAEHPATVPVWRRQRPSLLVEGAEYRAGAEEGAVENSAAEPTGRLLLTGYIRCGGLSANQLIHIPGAGDFQIDRIEGIFEGGAHGSDRHGFGASKKGQGGRSSSAGGHAPRAGSGVGDGEGDSVMDVSDIGTTLLAQHDDEVREAVVRVNQADRDGEDGEQTWPSEQELLDVQTLIEGKRKKRNLPAGTSEYQAAWLLDDEEDGEEEEDEEEEEEEDNMVDSSGMNPEGRRGNQDDEVDEAPELHEMVDDEEAGSDTMALDEEAGDDAALYKELRSRHKQEQEQAQEEYPDEVDVPTDVPARVRFQKYRGLKSFRSSTWDSKEWLPAEYSRVFAFENFKRAHKRAKAAVERATAGLDPCAAAPGSLVVVHVVGVSASQAQVVLGRVPTSPSPHLSEPQASLPMSTGSPLVAFGLMQHEGKMSVLHGGIKKVASYSEPIRNKEQLLFVTGVRAFQSCPIFSADTPGDKQKMERFLLPGRHVIASMYAPISYGPLPFLAFKVMPQLQSTDIAGSAGLCKSNATQALMLAASGALRGCDPDRIMLKKITLTGYPTRVHKRRATVKFMFHNPDDIRWFRPVELYTKRGRRGRITDAIGTHGAMKCLFDCPVEQRDVVCMSLYKRAFPKWPKDLTFA